MQRHHPNDLGGFADLFLAKELEVSRPDVTDHGPQAGTLHADPVAQGSDRLDAAHHTDHIGSRLIGIRLRDADRMKVRGVVKGDGAHIPFGEEAKVIEHAL